MRNFALLAAAVAMVSAQSTDTVETAPPMGVYKTEAWQPLVTATTILGDSEATATPTAVAKRDAVCVPQPTGILHQSPTDTAAGFLADPYYSAQASAAAIPGGFSTAFINTQSSNNADNYMGYTLMSTYDVQTCADKCTAIDGCASFNIYFERDPSVNPDSNTCANPPSAIQIKCVWWGGIIDKNTNVNSGQWRNQFQVVIAGSNGYINKAAAAVAATAVSSAPAAATTVANTAGSNYAIFFSSDSTVGAFANAAASNSYADCTTACDNTATCKAFTYVGGTNGQGSGTCWLKSSFGSPSKAGNNVVSGVKVAAAQVAAAVSTTTTSSSASATSTSTSTSTTTTTSASSTTLATSTKPTTSSTTTSTTTTSSQPAVTTGASFYMKINNSKSTVDGQYAVVSGGAGGAITFTRSLTSATKFAYDSNGLLLVASTGYAAYVPNTDGAWKYLQFNAPGLGLAYTSCSGTDLIYCTALGSGQYAGVCSNDNYKGLWFGLPGKTPSTCGWTGLYYVAA